MSRNLEIDARGMNRMIRSLKQYNNVQTRVVVRAITAEILKGAANKTQAGSAKAVQESIKKDLRRPFEVRGKGYIGVQNNGNVWANLVRWGNKKKWMLVNQGNLKQIGTNTTRKGKPIKVNKRDRSEINSMIKYVQEWKKKETAYRKSKIGMSKATWIELIRKLGLPMPKGIGKKPMSVVLPPKAKAALKAWETTSSRDNYTLNIFNAVEAALNKNSKGIGAFASAFNGKVKEFERAAAKDAKAFAKKFAERNGFDVK